MSVQVTREQLIKKKVIIYTEDNYPEKLAECIQLRNQGIAAELIPAR